MRMQNAECRMQNWRLQISFCILNSACCILTAGCGPAAIAQPQGVSSAGSLEVVQAGQPTRKTLTLATTQPARIVALEQTPIHSKLAAYVGEVLVDYGDRVKKDQPLVKLSAPELDAELAQKTALLDQARAEQVQAEAGLKAAQAGVATANSQVTATEARLVKTQADVDRWMLQCKRFEDLATSGSLNQQLVEETEQNCSAAHAAHKEALAAIVSAKAVVAQSEAQAAKAAADVEAAKSRVLVAQANVAHVEALRSYLTIKAPFDGVVTHRHVDPGHFVQPAAGNGTTLLVVAREDQLRVFVAVPEMEAAYVDVGDEATIDVQSLRGAEFKGAVTRTGFALAAGSRSLETIVDLENKDGRLRPGLYGVAKITLQVKENALTLPAAAVVRQNKEAFCYRLIGGKAAKTPLQLGLFVGGDWEIASGLGEKDAVILNKAASLADGQRVEQAPPAAK